MKKTLLTEEFDYVAFRHQHGSRATVLFIVGKAGTLRVCTADEPPAPLPGQKLVSLIEPPPPASAAAPSRPPPKARSATRRRLRSGRPVPSGTPFVTFRVSL